MKQILDCDGCNLIQPYSWIAVEKRLPENETIVIVNGGIARYRNGVWFTGMEEPMFTRQIEWVVTHWMPFPKLNIKEKAG